MALSAKNKARTKLLEYLGNPENDFLNRAELSNDVLGYKNANQINVLFTASELAEIEDEALGLRKKRTAPQRSRVYAALLKEAEDGNLRAIKEYLDRTEGKVKDNINLDVGFKLNELLAGLAPEAAGKLKDILKGRLTTDG